MKNLPTLRNDSWWAISSEYEFSFFSITICRNFFHQNKSLQGFFFTIQCHFIIPRIKTLKKPERSPIPLLTRGLRVASVKSYCGHCDMQVCHSDVDTFRNQSDRMKTSDIKTTIVVDRSFPFRDQELLSVHDCAQSF